MSVLSYQSSSWSKSTKRNSGAANSILLSLISNGFKDQQLVFQDFFLSFRRVIFYKTMNQHNLWPISCQIQSTHLGRQIQRTLLERLLGWYLFSKIFRTTTSRGCFCLNTLQLITVYCCDWFYFPVRPIWHSKECFSAKFLMKRGTRTPCTAYLKKDTIPLYA